MDVWNERYRPKRLDEIVGQPLIINKLKQAISTGNITNYMFSGPNGTGKTTAAYAVANGLFDGELGKGNFKMINASEQRWRSINVVDKVIIPFMRTRPVFTDIPFKLLLLEEADNLTKDAQKALRVPFEKYNNLCRIIATVNYPDNLIPAISSRFTRFDFTPIESGAMVNRLREISQHEEISFTKEQYNSIVDKVDGDLRKAVNILQNMKVDTSDFNGVFR